MFRTGELTKRMALLLQPIKHALLHDTQPSILEVRATQLTLMAIAWFSDSWLTQFLRTKSDPMDALVWRVVRASALDNELIWRHRSVTQKSALIFWICEIYARMAD